MKRLQTLALLLATVSLVMLAYGDHAICWQPYVPPMGAPMGQMGAPCPPPACGPAPMPFAMGPCFPQKSCTKFSFEGGGRLFYTSNAVKLTHNNQATIDFVRDLNFSQNTLVGEVFGAVRICPTLAFTYTFMIPRDDEGNGLLPANLVVDNTVFAAGQLIAAKTTTSLHRWEGEAYPIIGCNYRVGGLLFAELLIERLRVEDGIQSDSEEYSEFLMGIGGVAEYAPADNVYARVKAAYTFLQNQNGFYLDGEGKFFPEFNKGCGPTSMPSGMRPYVGAGYRYRYAEWSRNEGNDKLEITIHGPYAEVGVIF